MRKLLLTLSISLIPLVIFGHSGHGIFDGNSIQHYIGSPLHIAPLLVVSVYLFWVFRKKLLRSK